MIFLWMNIIETFNHFRATDYCIDIAEEPLSEDIIKHIHYLLKIGTKDETLSWFKIGDYKLRPNFVGGIETTAPKNVGTDIKALLSAYLKKKTMTLKDLIDFHYRFELIHPFQDGNGRVGRLIAFKECLKNNLMPFIIEDRKNIITTVVLKNTTMNRASSLILATMGRTLSVPWFSFSILMFLF